MKRAMAMICALMICVLSACGTQQSPVVSEMEAATDAVSEAVPAAEPEPAPEPAEPQPEPEPEESLAEEPEEAPVETPEPVVYPFEEKQTFSVFCPADSMAFMLMTQMGLEENWSNVPTLQYVYDSVNFAFEFVTCGEQARSEQFNLMIASGDWTDLFESSLYTGGATQAFAEGVVIDLTELVPEQMPDYWALVQQQTAADQANLYNDEKQILSINDISGTVDRSSGLLMRKDMLEGVGMDTPGTIAELEPVLKAVHETYGTEQTIYVGQDGILGNVIGAFDCAGFDVSASTADPGFFVQNGSIQVSLLSENYYDYLVYFKQLYDEGIIYSDFYSAVPTAASMNSLSLGGAFIWNGDGGLIDSMTETGRAEIPGYELVGIAAMESEPGSGYHYAAANSTVAESGTCISAACTAPEEALQMLNWYFTEAGREFCVWGVEGLTFTRTEQGNAFTEAVTQGIFPVNLMYGFYIWSPSAVYLDKSVLYDQYSDAVLEAYGLWGQADSANTVPSSLSLNAEESETYTKRIGDICTVASEQILRWILGEETLDKESFAALGETLKQTGIQECIDIYQVAYDRYQARTN